MNYIYLDIEGNDLYPAVSKVYCVVTTEDGKEYNVWCDGDYSGSQPLSSLLFYLDLDYEYTIVAHSGYGYDFPVLEEFYGIKAQYCDTVSFARALFPSDSIIKLDATRWSKVLPKELWGTHSLKAWGYRLGLHKDEFHDFSGFSKEMVDYCIQDVRVLYELHQWLLEEQKRQGVSDEVIQLEQRVSQIVQEQMFNGVCFNVEAARQLDDKLRVKLYELEEQLQKVFPPTVEYMKTPQYYLTPDDNRYPTIKAATSAGWKREQIIAGPVRTKIHHFNPGSRPQIVHRLKEKYDWEPTVFTDKGNPKLDDDVIKGLPYVEAEVLAEYLLVQKRVSQLSGSDGNSGVPLLDSVSIDGKIYGYVNTCGCRTYRMSHSGPNLAQIPSVDAPYGEEFRALFHASDGMVMVGIDASGLEGRFKGHYLYPFDNGTFVDLVLTGADLHTRNAEILDLDRSTAKTWYYAWLFGAGPERLAAITGRSVAQEAKYKQLFLDEWPELAQLLEAVVAAYKKRGYLIGLDGRRLDNESDHTALNTVIQSAGAILMKVALVKFYDLLTLRYNKDHWRFILNVHDEWQLECSPQFAEEIGQLGVQCIEAAAIELGVNCPMTGEYKVGKTWAETH